MKRFYFIFLAVVLVFLYSIPGVFCLSGGGDSFLFIFGKTIPVVLVFLYSIPGVFYLSGGGDSFLFLRGG